MRESRISPAGGRTGDCGSVQCGHPHCGTQQREGTQSLRADFPDGDNDQLVNTAAATSTATSTTAHHHHYEQFLLDNHGAERHDNNLSARIYFDGPAVVYHDHTGDHADNSTVCTDDHGV